MPRAYVGVPKLDPTSRSRPGRANFTDPCLDLHELAPASRRRRSVVSDWRSKHIAARSTKCLGCVVASEPAGMEHEDVIAICSCVRAEGLPWCGMLMHSLCNGMASLACSNRYDGELSTQADAVVKATTSLIVLPPVTLLQPSDLFIQYSARRSPIGMSVVDLSTGRGSVLLVVIWTWAGLATLLYALRAITASRAPADIKSAFGFRWDFVWATIAWVRSHSTDAGKQLINPPDQCSGRQRLFDGVRIVRDRDSSG